jgi:nitroreductase
VQDVDWETAINSRRSARSFESRAVDEDSMSLLKRFAAGPHAPIDSAFNVRFFTSRPDSNLYNNRSMRSVDHAAFMSPTDVLSVSKAGFRGEIFVLYATSLGLATCWYGHYSLPELERLMPHLGEDKGELRSKWGYGKGEPPGERAICITPLGYWQQEGLRLLDRMTQTFVSHRRKPISELLTGGVSAERLPPEIMYALDLARKAPSAANSQFWRFTVSPNFQTISVSMPIGYRHFKWQHPNVDIGICASHIWLGLRLKSVETRVQVSNDGGRAVWRFSLNTG